MNLDEDLVEYSYCNEQAIIDRTEKLFERLISAWLYCGLADVKDNDVTGRSSRLLFIGDKTIKVNVWREVLEHNSTYYQELLNTIIQLIFVEKIQMCLAPSNYQTVIT